jgi:hypothetical protein
MLVEAGMGEGEVMSASSMVVGTPNEISDYAPVLRWLLLNCLAALGLVALWYFGLLSSTLASDRTHISWAIGLIFALTALNCLYHTAQVSRELVASRRVRQIILDRGADGLAIGRDGVVTDAGEVLEPSTLTAHIANLLTKANVQGGVRFDQTLLLRALADRLRNRERLGLFVSEALLRLALLGTAIGFILMLVPIANLDSFDPDKLRNALSGMTGGMSIALSVTVTGIASALVLKFEFYLLDGAIADLFDLVTETSEIYVMSALERRSNARP